MSETVDLNGEVETYSALQCRLDCNTGYASDLSPLITCVEGSYDAQLDKFSLTDMEFVSRINAGNQGES